MAFLQGKRYMFNMVVLIYIFLHSSKYSINTMNKPSHNVSLFSASGIFVAIWYQSVSALGILNGQGKKTLQNLTSTLLTSRDKTKKYSTSNMKNSSRPPQFKQWYWLEDIFPTYRELPHWEGYNTHILQTRQLKWGMVATTLNFEDVIFVFGSSHWVILCINHLSFDVLTLIATEVIGLRLIIN